MSILIDNDTRVLVQGITGAMGSFHAKQMIEYGTQVVAGTRPGLGGTLFVNRYPSSTRSPTRWTRRARTHR